jgi:hypothetical protein
MLDPYVKKIRVLQKWPMYGLPGALCAYHILVCD